MPYAELALLFEEQSLDRLKQFKKRQKNHSDMRKRLVNIPPWSRKTHVVTEALDDSLCLVL